MGAASRQGGSGSRPLPGGTNGPTGWGSWPSPPRESTFAHLSRSRICTSTCALLRAISGLPYGPLSQARSLNLSAALLVNVPTTVELVGGQG